MKDRLQRLWIWFTTGLPEVLLGLFLLSLVPMVVLGVGQLAGSIVGIIAAPDRFWRSTVQNPWAPLATILCLLGIAFVVYKLVGHWGVVWAVARKMIVEALNRKIVVVLLLFFVVLAPLLPFVLESEGGAVKSQVQMVLLYSMALSLALMSLVAIFVATASICSEVEYKQVHITDTKPLRRWEFLLGKWFGVFVLCGVVLFAMGGLGYVLVRYTAATATTGIITGARDKQDQLREAREADNTPTYGIEEEEPEDILYNPVEEEVFTARRAVAAGFDPIFLQALDRYVDERVKEWRADMIGGRRAAEFSKRQAATQEYYSLLQTALPGKPIWWDFEGLERDKEITVKFKAHQVGSERVFGIFTVCDKTIPLDEEGERTENPDERNQGGTPQYTPRINPETGRPLQVYPGSDGGERYADGWPTRSVVEVKLPPGSVQKDGHVFLRFEALRSPTGAQQSVVFDVEEKVELLQQQGSFMGNYYRSLLIILCQVGLLAALGMLAGSLFSFPVASFIVVFLFVGGLLAPWFFENFLEPSVYERVTPEGYRMMQMWRFFGKVVLFPLPNFGAFSPMQSLANGRTVAWSQVAMAGGLLMFLKGALALAIASFFYARRELARVVI